jgi:hypothetical protein
MSFLFRVCLVQVLVYLIISVFALMSRTDDVISLMRKQDTKVDDVIEFFQQKKKEKTLLR